MATAADHRRDLRVVTGDNRMVRRTLSIAALDEALAVFDGLTEALTS